MRATDGRYIRFVKFRLENEKLRFLLDKVNVDICSGNSLGIFHFNSSLPYISENDEVKLMIETADYCIKNRSTSTTPQAALFYKNAKAALHERGKVYAQYEA